MHYLRYGRRYLPTQLIEVFLVALAESKPATAGAYCMAFDRLAQE